MKKILLLLIVMLAVFACENPVEPAVDPPVDPETALVGVWRYDVTYDEYDGTNTLKMRSVIVLTLNSDKTLVMEQTEYTNGVISYGPVSRPAFWKITDTTFYITDGGATIFSEELYTLNGDHLRFTITDPKVTAADGSKIQDYYRQ